MMRTPFWRAPAAMAMVTFVGVYVPIIGGVQRAEHPFEIVERMQLCDGVWADQFDVEAKGAPHREGMAQPIHFIFGIGEAERAAAVPCDGLACFCL